MNCYLIHFDAPIGDPTNPHGQALHYLGATDDLEERLDAHQHGNGSAIMAFVSRAGIGWQLAKVWEGGFDLEKALKRQHNHKRFCPICKEAAS